MSLSLQAVTDHEFPQEELGFSSVGELLQRVPGVEMKRPPNASSVMVYPTHGGQEGEEEEEEEAKKKKKKMAEEVSKSCRGVILIQNERVMSEIASKAVPYTLIRNLSNPNRGSNATWCALFRNFCSEQAFQISEGLLYLRV